MLGVLVVCDGGLDYGSARLASNVVWRRRRRCILADGKRKPDSGYSIRSPIEGLNTAIVANGVLLVSSCGGGSAEGTTSCDDIDCVAPAECDDSKGEAICICPDGYRDVSGDGSKCERIDESVEGEGGEGEGGVSDGGEGEGGVSDGGEGEGEGGESTDNCPPNAVCTHSDGGFECASGYTDVSGTCKANDGTACDLDTDCVNGHCVAGICCASACNDPPECRTSRGAACTDGLTCVYRDEQDGAACDDGNACTTDDSCVSGACFGVERDCDDDNPCTDDSCDPQSGCAHANNADSCDDGDACTTNDTCNGGECASGDERDCDDGNACTEDSCDPDVGCRNTDISASCDDDNACTRDDCDPDVGCLNADISAWCNDGNVCTSDSCDPHSGCVNENNDVSCDDGDACTSGDTCDDGECVGGEPLTCDDGEFCTDDSCDPEVGCVFPDKDDDTPCEDGNACTEGDYCEAGTCIGGEPRDCDEGDICTTDSCDPELGCVSADEPDGLKAQCMYDEYETACSSIITPTIPLSSGLTYGNIDLQQGPYGSYIEWNEGSDFANPVNIGEPACSVAAYELGEPAEIIEDILDLRGQDLALYTVFRPACMKADETYPVITWGNGTCLQAGAYGPFLATVASHGFVIFAANTRFAGSGTEILHALDFAAAANEDPDSVYYQKLDLDNIGAMGHAQGSSGTAVAADDPRIDAIMFWNGGSSSNVKPFLAVSGDRDFGGTTLSSLTASVNGASQPGAWLWYHQVLETGGAATGHFTIVQQPDRVWEPAVAWCKYMLNNDQEAKDMLVGAGCGLCTSPAEYEYGHNSLLN